MFKYLLRFSVLLSFLFSQSIFAAGMEPKKELLLDIQTQTKICAVQISDLSKSDNKEIGFTSTCPSLRIISKSVAQIFIDGDWLQATISESSESDGGDLDDLRISDSKGQVIALKTNIPAYDNVIVAMAGTSELRKK